MKHNQYKNIIHDQSNCPILTTTISQKLIPIHLYFGLKFISFIFRERASSEDNNFVRDDKISLILLQGSRRSRRCEMGISYRNNSRISQIIHIHSSIPRQIYKFHCFEKLTRPETEFRFRDDLGWAHTGSVVFSS